MLHEEYRKDLVSKLVNSTRKLEVGGLLDETFHSRIPGGMQNSTYLDFDIFIHVTDVMRLNGESYLNYKKSLNL